MVSVVNDNCIKCKSCADVCPVDAFHEGGIETFSQFSFALTGTVSNASFVKNQLCVNVS